MTTMRRQHPQLRSGVFREESTPNFPGNVLNVLVSQGTRKLGHKNSYFPLILTREYRPTSALGPLIPPPPPSGYKGHGHMVWEDYLTTVFMKYVFFLWGLHIFSCDFFFSFNFHCSSSGRQNKTQKGSLDCSHPVRVINQATFSPWISWMQDKSPGQTMGQQVQGLRSHGF